jgi:hypothetical protein
MALEAYKGNMAKMEEWYNVNGKTPGVDAPEDYSVFEQLSSWLDSGWAQDMKDQADAGAQEVQATEDARKAFEAELKRLRDSNQGSGSGGPSTNIVGTSITTPTSLPSGQAYA